MTLYEAILIIKKAQKAVIEVEDQFRNYSDPVKLNLQYAIAGLTGAIVSLRTADTEEKIYHFYMDCRNDKKIPNINEVESFCKEKGILWSDFLHHWELLVKDYGPITLTEIK